MKQSKKKKGLKFLLATIAMGAITYLEKRVISKIPHKGILDYLNERLKDLREVIEILTDGNPEDRQQLEQLWQLHIRPRLREDNLDLAMDIIEEKIEDPIVLDIVIGILTEYYNESQEGAVRISLAERKEQEAERKAKADMQLEAA